SSGADAGAAGGAIDNAKTGSLTVRDSAFVCNRADGSVKGGMIVEGGAINSAKNAPSVTVSGCTFTNNQAIAGNGGTLATGQGELGSAYGGAIHVHGPSSTLTVSNSTFTGNEAIAGTGGSAPNGSNHGFYVLDAGGGGAIACAGEPTLVV